MQSYKFIDIHTHKLYDDGTIFIFSRSLWRDKEPPLEVLFSAGVHPWDASEADLEDVLQYLATVPAVAIGEIGLDYAADVPHDVQNRVFEEQLKVAERRNLPVIIHCVKAFNDVVNKLKLYNLPAVIFHGYIGSKEQTADLISRGYYISFGTRSLKSPKTIESLREATQSAIFAETDDEPEHVRNIYKQIASVRGISLGELSAVISNNFNRIFR